MVGVDGPKVGEVCGLRSSVTGKVLLVGKLAAEGCIASVTSEQRFIGRLCVLVHFVDAQAPSG